MTSGAGFAGLYMLHKLRQLGFTARVFERGVSLRSPDTRDRLAALSRATARGVAGRQSR